MQTITTSTFTNIRALAESTMLSTCTVDVYTTGSSGSETDSYGQIIETWVSGSPVKCGINLTANSNQYNPDWIKTECDAVIRLPHATIITKSDRITVDSVQYEIKGYPKKGISCIVVDVKRLGV